MREPKTPIQVYLSFSRDSTLGWDQSAIANADEPTQNAEHEDFPDTCDNTYTDDYNSADYTISETVEQTNTETPTQYEYQTVVLQDEFGNVINCENDEQIVFLQQDEQDQPPDSQTIGYFDGEKIIYVGQNAANETNVHDVGVQTNSQKPAHSYVPVFDVYMKNGNVTGFVVNDEVGKAAGGVEKGVQTPDDAVQK